MQPPILILAHAGSDPYSSYLAEMLRVEGLNWFAEASEPAAPLPLLVISAAQDVSSATADLLAAHVRAGGSLLACRPGPTLLSALGLPPAPLLPEDWSNRYVILEPGSPIVHNLPWVASSIQFFGRPIALPVNPNEPDPIAVARFAPFPTQSS